MSKVFYDLCIIGGGINGVGIAREAAGRGYSVLLLEKNDLASGTSSTSTKLAHGGLRYLEYGAFRLVHESLHERATILHIAPHISRPLRFVLPHDPKMRPAFMLRAGLLMYDFLAGRRNLRSSETVCLKQHPFGLPLVHPNGVGFTYSDGWVDDARLVVLNAMDAAQRGADIRTREGCRKLARHDGAWQIDTDTGATYHARMVINAAGPWVRDLLDANHLATPKTPNVRLVRGSHIITRRLYYGDQAYILQQADKRIVFAIPYEGRYTLIGTTEEVHHGAPETSHMSEAEKTYLLDVASRTFEHKPTEQDIVGTYSGVRPLIEDGAKTATSATRDYKLLLDAVDAPLLSVFGGKLTTYRALAEHALRIVDKSFKRETKRFSDLALLPGGDLPDGSVQNLTQQLNSRYPRLPMIMLQRYARTYGTLSYKILGDAEKIEDLGKQFAPDLYECEVQYLQKHEFAKTAEDILWRRTKLGLGAHADAATALNAYLGSS